MQTVIYRGEHVAGIRRRGGRPDYFFQQSFRRVRLPRSRISKAACSFFDLREGDFIRTDHVSCFRFVTLRKTWSVPVFSVSWRVVSSSAGVRLYLGDRALEPPRRRPSAVDRALRVHPMDLAIDRESGSGSLMSMPMCARSTGVAAQLGHPIWCSHRYS